MRPLWKNQYFFHKSSLILLSNVEKIYSGRQTSDAIVFLSNDLFKKILSQNENATVSECSI